MWDATCKLPKAWDSFCCCCEGFVVTYWCMLARQWLGLSFIACILPIYSIRHTQLKRLMFIHAWGCLWFTSTCTCKHLLFFSFVKYEDPKWNSESLQYCLVTLLLVFSLPKVDEKRFPILIVRVREVTSAAHTFIYAICISPLHVFSLLTRRKYQTSYKATTTWFERLWGYPPSCWGKFEMIQETETYIVLFAYICSWMIE